jgi:hypothetical protein
MKKSIFIVSLLYLMFSGDFFVKSQTYINRATGTITIDGVINEADWASAQQYNIDSIYITDDTGFTGPEDLTAYWKAVYDDNGIYILTNVTADDVHSANGSYGAPWEQDMAELYFDMNTDNLRDGFGPASSGTGHYQIAGAALNGSTTVPNLVC